MSVGSGEMAVIDGIRRIIMRWVITRTDLIADANAGDTSISVNSTRRFRVGEQFVIHNDEEFVENDLHVLEVVDKNTIRLADGAGNVKALKWSWPMSAGAHVVKSFNGMIVKAVFFGEPDIIDLGELPAISVSPSKSNSEFFTFRATKEKHNLEITVYVSGTTQEEGDRLLVSLVDVIQYGLKRNFYPLLDDYKTCTITAPIAIGDEFIKIGTGDIPIFGTEIVGHAGQYTMVGSNQIIIEDQHNIHVNSIHSICSDGTLRLHQVVDFDFTVDDAIIIKPNRLPFNSWPTDITFGKIKKGTLLKAATISYFVEEMEDHQDASFGDTQLR